MKGLISVIIPMYNEEEYIERCILSIINQSYKNIEILIIDDGSTDSSLDICLRYQECDSRVKIFSKENGGLSSARNYGLDKVRGEYIYFADGNDFISLNTIECMHDIILKQKCDIVMGNYYRYINGEDRTIMEFDDFMVSGDTKYDYLYNEYNYITIISCNKLYKRSIFNDLRFKEGLIHEDEYIITDLLKKSNKIYYCGKALYHYSFIDDSLSNSVSIKSLNDLLTAYDKRAKFFLENGNDDILLKTLMHEFYLLSNNLLLLEAGEKFISKLKDITGDILSFKDISLVNRLRYNFCFYFPRGYINFLRLYKRL